MPTIAPPKRHRLWPWILGLVLTPFVMLGIMIASVIQLNGDATALRKFFMAATGDHWHTKVQVSVSPVLASLVRTGVSFIHDLPPEAGAALRAVRSASVGVYEQSGPAAPGAPGRLIVEADEIMTRRGWIRVLGVVDEKNTVLIYLPARRQAAMPSRMCLAAYSGRELVVVAAGFDAEMLGNLVAREMNGRLPLKL
jgi:hypothetical protein